MKKNLLITGGGSGLGQAIAWRFAEQGFKVYIVGRNKEKLQITKSRFPAKIHPLNFDLAKLENLQHIAQQIEEESLTFLIHNAGSIEPIVPLREITYPTINKNLTINLITPILLTQVLLPKLVKARILHISSFFAHNPGHSTGAYCISKAALYMAKETFNLENKGNKDFLVGSLMPGIIDTEMHDQLIYNESQQQNFHYQLKLQQKLILPQTAALFVDYVLQKTTDQKFICGDWDIYHTDHQSKWLMAGHKVPIID